MRSFEFTWYEIQDRNKIERHNIIKGSIKDDAEVGAAAKLATDLFCKTFGNLKKNTIISIQEIDKDGRPVGEVITPMGESKVIPVGR